MDSLPDDVLRKIIVIVQRDQGQVRCAQVVTNDTPAPSLPLFELQLLRPPSIQALACLSRLWCRLVPQTLLALAWRSLPDERLGDEFAVYLRLYNA